MNSEDAFMMFLKWPDTTIEMVERMYKQYPRLSGHMVEELFYAKRLDLLQFFHSVNWFRMAGRDFYTQLIG